MNIALLLTGKTTAAYLETGIDIYEKRLKNYTPFEMITVPDIKRAHLSFEQQKEAEGKMMLQKITSTDFVVLLDERGEMFSSESFARFLEKKIMVGTRRVLFVIGGPYGFSEAVYQRADAQLSFSKFTFSHQMIRLLFVEQLYRAFTILRGEPYHHS